MNHPKKTLTLVNICYSYSADGLESGLSSTGYILLNISGYHIPTRDTEGKAQLVAQPVNLYVIFLC